MSRYPFPHERLDAWHRACEARKLALEFTASLPLGFGDEARQINNAAGSVVRNVCEGASRSRPAEKVLKFEIAQGEAGESVGAVQCLLLSGLSRPAGPTRRGRGRGRGRGRVGLAWAES